MAFLDDAMVATETIARFIAMMEDAISLTIAEIIAAEKKALK